MEQNELLAMRCMADPKLSPAAEGVADGCAACRMIEIFAAILPIEWG